MVTRLTTSRDHETRCPSRTWPRYAWGPLSWKRLDIDTQFQWRTYRKWQMESNAVMLILVLVLASLVLVLACSVLVNITDQMVTLSIQSRDPLRAGGVARSWRRFRSKCERAGVQDSLINSQNKLTNDSGRKNIRAPSCDPDSLARLPSNQLNKCSSLSQYTTFIIHWLIDLFIYLFIVWLTNSLTYLFISLFLHQKYSILEG